MSKNHIIIPAIFLIQTTICTVFAWGGSHFSLIMLAVTSVILSVALGFYIRGWWSALDRWGVALVQWEAAQNWGVAANDILGDVLTELSEYDEEAVFIHSGRSLDASRAYAAALDGDYR